MLDDVRYISCSRLDQGYWDTYNCKRSCIEEAVLTTLDDLALLTDTDEVGGFDETKRSSEWVHPERIWFNGVAVRDVTLRLVSFLN